MRNHMISIAVVHTPMKTSLFRYIQAANVAV